MGRAEVTERRAWRKGEKEVDRRKGERGEAEVGMKQGVGMWRRDAGGETWKVRWSANVQIGDRRLGRMIDRAVRGN